MGVRVLMARRGACARPTALQLSNWAEARLTVSCLAPFIAEGWLDKKEVAWYSYSVPFCSVLVSEGRPG